MTISYSILIVALLLIQSNSQIQTLTHLSTNDQPRGPPPPKPCQPNTILNPDTGKCICPRGSKKEGDSCVQICLPEEIYSTQGKCCSVTAFNPDYVPQGKIEDIQGLKTYVVGKGDKVLVMFSDIFGAESGKHRSIADTYACLGFKVYLTQFLDPPYEGSIEELAKIYEVVQMQKVATIRARFQTLLKHIKGKEQECDKILAAGFCWGAWAAFKMSAQFSEIKAIAAVHPSLNVQNFYGSNETQLVQSIKSPAHFYPCGNDQPAAKQGGEYVKILADKFGADKVGTIEFPDQKHGFIMRHQFSNEFSFRDTRKILELSSQYLQRFA